MNTQPVSIKNRPGLFLATYMIGVIVIVGLHMLDLYKQPTFVLGPSGQLTPRVITIGDFLKDFLFFFLFLIVFLPWGFVATLQWLLEHTFGIQANFIQYMGTYEKLFLPENIFGTLLIGLSYLVLFVLPIAGSRTKKERTFRILYFSFLGWVIMNVAGCLSYSF